MTEVVGAKERMRSSYRIRPNSGLWRLRGCHKFKTGESQRTEKRSTVVPETHSVPWWFEGNAIQGHDGETS